MTAAPTPEAAPTVAEVLGRGEMTVHGRIAGSSNATLLVTCTVDGTELLAVYKPARGERPLWDFPSGLHRREVAAYVLSEALGWGLVPETVERAEAPFGPGSVQRLVPEDGRSHYFTLRDDDRWRPTLVSLAAFDVVANNADRKSGHVLLAEDRLWAIDHGLTFHEEAKLRTVIWDFAGEPLPDRVGTDLERLVAGGPPGGLAGLLDDDEVEALHRRARALVEAGELPAPDGDREWPPYPWPLV
ncbi:MAG TPA: SCO1664 family protein [Acidimicrobiales bacterium]|nr:SCO1664 family protein [Acidimicrobiales bacterium]